MRLFGKKKKEEKVSYDRSTQYPAIRCSICTGEQVAGLRERGTGGFTDLMLIRGEEDLDAFRRMIGLSPEEPIEKFF